MDFNETVISQFRAGDQRIADTFDREYLLLLHTTGAKSGQERISPVAHFTVDGSWVIVASAAGADKNPAWFGNLTAHPHVTVEVWRDDQLVTDDVTAEVVPEGPERDRLWDHIVELSPGFADYQTKTDRVIPLVRLT